MPPDTYWPLIREICTKYDVAMIADEVMCGFCRTGTMFCIDHWDVVPDVMAMSKGITGGYMPMGAVAFNDKIWDGLKGISLMHQYTFSGSPAGCAAAIAAIDVYVNDDVAEQRHPGRPAHRRPHRERVHADALRRHPQRARPDAGHGDRRRQADQGHVRPARGADHAAARRGPASAACTCGRWARTASSSHRPCTTTIEEADRIVDILKPLVAAIEPPD